MATTSELSAELPSLPPLERLQRTRTTERDATVTVDLRLLDYVSVYDENLMCPICRCPFIDPVMLADCDHHFCRDCIRQCWSAGHGYAPLATRGQCPTCRSPARLSSRAATSKILANIIGELLVKCPRSAEGCSAVIKRDEVQAHTQLYCGYSLVGCSTPGCRELAPRREALCGCVHFPVSCVDCHAEMQVVQLERHWKDLCPDREVMCKHCEAPVFYRQLDRHYEDACSVRPVACPGQDLGCTHRDHRAGIAEHVPGCVFARLVPLLNKQKERLDEQEAAQRQMSRKLRVLEDGFAAMRDILHPQHVSSASPPSSTADHGPRHGDANSTLDNMHGDDLSTDAAGAASATDDLAHVGGAMPMPHRNRDWLSMAHGLAATPPPATDGALYVSPLHHLLSMHEALRDEMSRISSTLSELEGRHSMQILNENLRTREEISYLAAQVGGLQRQVHWLTSAQLQRQQTRTGAAGSSASADGNVNGVVDAVSSAATALRGAAQMAGFAPGQERRGREGVRRGASEEGRTKL